MPRTKRPAKKPEKLSERNEALGKFETAVMGYKSALDNRAQMEVSNVEMAYKILIGSISKEYLNMTIGQLKSELLLKDMTNTRQASHDDGYMTERSSQDSESRTKKIAPPSSSRTVSRSRRSRSADTRGSARKPAPSTVGRSHSNVRTAAVYRTPAYNKNATQAYPVITPKVAPHSTLTLLRQPRNGEMVVSLTGSPVMVQTFSNMQPDEKANCNIRLADGTMLSLQPKQLSESRDMIPFSLMDDQVIAQLKTLEGNLQKVLKMAHRK